MTGKVSGKWKMVTVRSGDTLSELLYRYHVPVDTIYRLLQVADSNKLATLKPGASMHLKWNEAQLSGLKYFLSPMKYLFIERTAEKRFVSKLVTLRPEKRQVRKDVTIKDSLFLSGSKAGLSDRLIMQLADIFDSRIDFVYDIHPGDSFSIVYEEQVVNDKKVRSVVLAARFRGKNQVIDAIRHVGGNGNSAYYTPEGESLENAFSRTPVDFTRISSGFTHKRMHPIFGKTRPHRAIDYAAPMNTPVKVTADGIISFLGHQRGYGNVIYVKHGNKIMTLYAHLNRFGKGLKKGSRVKKGELIAYVGMTGYATGPHLHYEFRVNGVHQNPLTVKLPKGKPIPASQMAMFKSHSTPLLAKLGMGAGKLAMETRESSGVVPEI